MDTTLRTQGSGRTRTLTIVILSALALTPPASGHSAAPFWSKAEAERYVMLGPIELNDRTLRVSDVACFGNGKLRLRVRGVLKYQHFNCLVTPGRERRFWLALHPLRRGWTWNFLEYA